MICVRYKKNPLAKRTPRTIFALISIYNVSNALLSAIYLMRLGTIPYLLFAFLLSYRRSFLFTLVHFCVPDLCVFWDLFSLHAWFLFFFYDCFALDLVVPALSHAPRALKISSIQINVYFHVYTHAPN